MRISDWSSDVFSSYLVYDLSRSPLPDDLRAGLGGHRHDTYVAVLSHAGGRAGDRLRSWWQSFRPDEGAQLMFLVVIGVAILVALMIIGVPVALAFAATVIFLVTTGDYGSAMFLVPAGLGKISSITMVAVSLYLLAGHQHGKRAGGEKS